MNNTAIQELNEWLKHKENYHLEFKEAKNQFNYKHKLEHYCAALANEGGGKLILGVNNQGAIVGSKAYEGTYNKLANQLLEQLGIRIEVEELSHPDGRVLIFHVPSHYIGQPVKCDRVYWMRAGESLTSMDEMTLRKKLIETLPDFSNETVNDFNLSDLDEKALNEFKKRWAEKSKRQDYLQFSNEKILCAAGLLSGKELNYAALILFGKKEKISELLSGSEIIFEWRHISGQIHHDFRINWREPFFKIYDEIWNTINQRNLRIPFQDGLFQREIWAFNEKVIREALLNAVTHRDYHIQSNSIFIKASPEFFVIESPGGFPPGITLENILDKQEWRNRKIAETFEKADLVERSGQGVNDIFGYCIKEGKGLPDYSKSDAYRVILKIPAQVKDKGFIVFLERIAHETGETLSFEEIYELEKIREEQKVDNIQYRDKFLKMGLIEMIGRTNDRKFILSDKYYSWEGKSGIHTKLVGLNRQQKKELILNHIKKRNRGMNKDFCDALSELKEKDIANLLQELKREGKIIHVGSKRKGYWIMSKTK